MNDQKDIKEHLLCAARLKWPGEDVWQCRACGMAAPFGNAPSPRDVGSGCPCGGRILPVECQELN